MGEDGAVSSRALLLLTAAIGVAVVLAAGLTRVSYSVDGREVTCPGRAFTSAAESLTDRTPDACAAAAQNRIYSVAAALMGLVLISGLLSRRSS